MIPIHYSAEALEDLERLALFLVEAGSEQAEEAMRRIVSALRTLSMHPYIGRATRRGLRELVIGFGRAGYVAVYRIKANCVEVLRIRHQREAGTPR